MSSSASPRSLLIPGFRRILHGGDYNPDQWLHAPEVIEEDFRLMAASGCNTFTLGVFAWTSYEREEGVFDFGWLDRIFERMAGYGHKVILATPSGAKPAWMASKYPEIRRVNAAGLREPHWHRHNHCWSSPVYREKVGAINAQLAGRYGRHPALAMWHVSNELGNDSLDGQCFCPLCLGEWRHWLERRYETLESLNRSWWSSFWSHEFTEWEQIDPRDWSMDSLSVDWLRFRNWQIQEWYEFETETLKSLSPGIPVSTNFMGMHPWIDYAALARKVDFIMDDQYPAYEIDDPGLIRSAAAVSFKNSLYRTFKPDLPWMLVESCPDAPQWKERMRPKPESVHQLEMLQALGHGAEGTCYFQWRKGRGSREKLHGAVVDHSGREDARVFRSVTALSRNYERLEPILGSKPQPARVGLVYDWEARWGLEFSEGAARGNNAYEAVAGQHYSAFWEQSIPVDVFPSGQDFSAYDMLILPQLWMLKPGVARRLEAYVEQGGILVATSYLGICDEANLCFNGGWPGDGLMPLFGLWNEEYDTLPGGETIEIVPVRGNALGLTGSLSATSLCGILRDVKAEVVAAYGSGMFAGTPAITVHRHGQGEAWYVAPRLNPEALGAFYRPLARRLALEQAWDGELPPGVSVQRRLGDGEDYVFLENFTPCSQTVALGERRVRDLLTGGTPSESLVLPPAGSTVLAVPSSR